MSHVRWVVLSDGDHLQLKGQQLGAVNLQLNHMFLPLPNHKCKQASILQYLYFIIYQFLSKYHLVYSVDVNTIECFFGSTEEKKCNIFFLINSKVH